jgi:hypothetical protein
MPGKSSKAAIPKPASSNSPRNGDSASGEISVGPELAGAIRAINGRGGDPGEGMLGRYWELGRLIEVRVQTHEDRPSSKALAKLLGVEVTRLKVARKIFNAFPSAGSKERLLAMRRADGTPLPVWAVARLSSPSLAADREPLMERACREGWSEYDFKDKLKVTRRGHPHGRTGGRKHRPPRSLPLALARWHREADGLIRSVQAASRPEVIADLLALPDAAEVTTEHVREVRRVVQQALVALMNGLEMLEKIADGLASKTPGGDRSASSPTSGPKASTEASKPGRAKGRPRGSPG